MAEWSTSYRWSGVQRSNVVGLLRHDARDVDRQNGVEVAHSNALIDSSLTAMNESWVNDGAGRLVPMKKVEQAVAFLDRKIASARNSRTVKDKKTGQTREVPVAVRKDASVAVEFVLMLDPRYTRRHHISEEEYDALTVQQRAELPPDVSKLTPEQIADVREKLQAMIDEVTERMGADNVMAVTWHWDESTPHVQMLAVPMTEKGELSKKKVLGEASMSAAQAKYAAMHDAMRTRLRGVGYEATFERVDSGRPNQPLAAYKASKDRARQEMADLLAAERKASHAKELEERVVKDHEKLDEWDAALLDRRHELDEEAERLRDRQRDLETREAELPTLRRRLEEEGRRDGLEAAASAIDQTVEQKLAAALAPQLTEVNRLRAELEVLVAQRTREQQAFNAAAARFDQMCRSLQPLVEKWEQTNPHTERGSRAQSSAARFRQFEQRADELRESVPDDGSERDV